MVYVSKTVKCCSKYMIVVGLCSMLMLDLKTKLFNVGKSIISVCIRISG